MAMLVITRGCIYIYIYILALAIIAIFIIPYGNLYEHTLTNQYHAMTFQVLKTAQMVWGGTIPITGYYSRLAKNRRILSSHRLSFLNDR